MVCSNETFFPVTSNIRTLAVYAAVQQCNFVDATSMIYWLVMLCLCFAHIISRAPAYKLSSSPPDALTAQLPAESWNPMWSVGTILNGLLSFMYEHNITTGSISTSKAEKRRLAAISLEQNLRSPTFRKLFPDWAQEHERRHKAAQVRRCTLIKSSNNDKFDHISACLAGARGVCTDTPRDTSTTCTSGLHCPATHASVYLGHSQRRCWCFWTPADSSVDKIAGMQKPFCSV